MSDFAIRVSGLCKQYRLGQLEPYRTLRDSIMNTGRRLLHRAAGNRPLTTDHSSTLWALKDVSFDVKRGEVVGIIGRNGAGKSTLLKILSRITEPTSGQVELRGRVGSLLEVGTGFHPELTGRENIYLNGTILGMTRAEITRRFDEIVAFAEIEKFLDTPVKRYSSGMYVRLAFAVAAHLEPEILIVDEVLAVGDAEFQRKCLGKMSGVAESGRTVLFVSHNMAAVESLCTSAILLTAGAIRSIGATLDVIQTYVSVTESAYDLDLTGHPSRVQCLLPILRRLRVTDNNGHTLSSVGVADGVTFELLLDASEVLPGISVGIHLYSSLGHRVLTLHSGYQMTGRMLIDGPTVVRCTVPSLMLVPDRYSLVLAVANARGQLDRIEPACAIDVIARDVYGTGRFPSLRDGVAVSKATWRSDALECAMSK